MKKIDYISARKLFSKIAKEIKEEPIDPSTWVPDYDESDLQI